MKLNYMQGLFRNATLLVKRLMEESSEEFVNSMNKGELHQYLCGQVDSYLKINGIKADRKSVNVITDLGKELFITNTVEDLFVNRKTREGHGTDEQCRLS